MAHGEIYLVILNQNAIASGIDPGEVRHIISIGLKPANHRVFGIENPTDRGGLSPIVKWAVIANFIGTVVQITGRSVIHAEAAVGVVGLPGFVRSLEQNIGVARIVADDKDNMIIRPGIRPDQMCEINAGGSIG